MKESVSIWILYHNSFCVSSHTWTVYCTTPRGGKIFIGKHLCQTTISLFIGDCKTGEVKVNGGSDVPLFNRFWTSDKRKNPERRKEKCCSTKFHRNREAEWKMTGMCSPVSILPVGIEWFLMRKRQRFPIRLRLRKNLEREMFSDSPLH